MKRLVKICTALLAAAAVAVCAGCSARSAVSADDFQKRATESGYTVTANESAGSTVTKELDAVKDGTDVKVNFYTFKNSNDALSWYNTQKSSLSGTAKTIVDSDAYNKCTMTNGEIYCMLVRMDNTAIFCKTTIAKQAEAESLVSSFKY